jgi:hypothetical protein
MRSLRDVQNALSTGLSLHRGPVGEPGRGSYAGTFALKKKANVYLSSLIIKVPDHVYVLG